MEINIERKEVCRVVSARNLSEVKALMAGEKEIYMVFDRNASWVADKVTEMVPGVVRSFAFDTSEEAKSINAAMSLCALLLDAGASREALLLAVGGGITTDLTGFAASIYKRGIRYANIPTTLLAQVDAAIGGKTGVNFAGYKNMVGAIVQPAWTFICPEVLKTLQRRDFLSGAAEMLKTFLLDDGDGSYECAVTLLSKMHAAENAHGDSWQAIFEDDADQWAELLRRAAAIKAGVVERDPFEKGERRILNLGHTFAHAIEALQFSEGHHGCCGRHGGCGHHGEGQEHHCCHGEEGHEEGHCCHGGDGHEGGHEHHCGHGGEGHEGGCNGGHRELTHGEAVAAGIILAARLSENAGVAERGLAERLEADFKACGLPVSCRFSPGELSEAMGKDKKAEGDTVRFILPAAVGRVEEKSMSAAEAVSML